MQYTYIFLNFLFMGCGDNNGEDDAENNRPVAQQRRGEHQNINSQSFLKLLFF
jgi:hypothetical protein